MNDTLAPLILDFLDWIAPEPRPYSEVMETWRTSCPRLTVWEDSLDQGYVARRRVNAGEMMVEITAAGRALLQAHDR